jgi:ABC-type polysaccharide/polyol phosphate transport system ATPase subunit
MPAGGILQQLRGALFPKRFGYEREILLNDFTFWLGRGESFAVLGADEPGVTALLRLIGGYIPPSGGNCTVEGRVASAISAEDTLVKTETGEGNAFLAFSLSGIKESEKNAYIEAVEKAACVYGQFKKPVSTYDEAKRARLRVCMAMAANPDVLVISKQLEICGPPYLERYIKEFGGMIKNGMTLLIEGTDYAMLGRLCESAILIENGKLKRVGLFETVLREFMQPKAFDVSRFGPVQVPAKAWMENAKAAWSEPFLPLLGDDRQGVWPADAKSALEKAKYDIDRLNGQLTDYARANLAFDEENQKLQAALQKQIQATKKAEEQLRRVMNAVEDTLSVMRRQFDTLMEEYNNRPPKS